MCHGCTIYPMYPVILQRHQFCFSSENIYKCLAKNLNSTQGFFANTLALARFSNYWNWLPPAMCPHCLPLLFHSLPPFLCFPRLVPTSTTPCFPVQPVPPSLALPWACPSTPCSVMAVPYPHLTPPWANSVGLHENKREYKILFHAMDRWKEGTISFLRNQRVYPVIPKWRQ